MPRLCELTSENVARWLIAASGALLAAELVGFWSLLNPLFSALVVLHLLVLAGAVGLSLGALHSWCRSAGKSGAVLACATLLAWGLALAIGMLPITARDALIHHLAVPKWWLAEGKIYSIDWHDWSYYPMHLQVAFAALLKWGWVQATPCYHLAYGMLLAFFAADITKRLSNNLLGLVACFVTASTPVILKLSALPLVDLGLACFSCLCLWSMVRWLKDESSPQQLLYQAGAALGFAFSTKYNALLFAACLSPFALLAASMAKKKPSKIANAVLVIGLVSALVYSPWMWRNYQATQNPFYPLYQSFFQAQPARTPADPEAARGLSVLETRRLLHHESWTEIALLPIRVFVSGEDDNPALFDGRLSPFFLLAILGLARYRNRPSVTLLGSSGVLYFMLALTMSDARVRYLAPIFGPLVVLSCLGIAAITERVKSTASKEMLPDSRPLMLIGGVLIHAAWGLSYTGKIIPKMHALEYFSGTWSETVFLEHTVPEYGLAEYMNANLAPSSRTYLVLTGNRFYYFNTPVKSSGHSSAGELLSWIRLAPDAAAIEEEFQKRGFTHLLINRVRFSELYQTSLQSEAQARWRDFMALYLKPLSADPGSTLYALRSSETPESRSPPPTLSALP